MKNLKVRLAALVLLATQTVTLVGCSGRELAPQEDYDIVEQQEDKNFIGLTQIIDVPGRDFKLVTEYSCDDISKREWRVTSDKFLYFNVKTEGLSEDTQVYIDNIHIDTSIKSKYASMDGILQDSMDDRVHSSMLIGFPISNTTKYYGVNAIEGSNYDFIQGTFYGYKGYQSAEIEQKRYTEKDYLRMGVYANKIIIVYDLLVKGPNDLDFTNVSVCTDFLVPITTKEIAYETKEEETTYQKTK